MPNDKVDNELNLALDVNPVDRNKATNLDVGYTPDTDMWELIVKYNGSLEPIREQLNISVVELMNGYAIITIPEYLIDRLSDFEQIEFIEKPKRLFYEVNEGRTASCINPL
ncbi:MAG: peptidase S8, partial [Mobilitalea sp.]